MNNFNLQVGLSGSIETNVVENNTAGEMGSGTIDVFATPAMVALMEKAALSAVQPHIPAGFSTVGTAVNITHIAATPMGMKVKAYAELIKVEDKKLTFRVEAFDEAEKIGEGTHERYIINIEKFRGRVYSKGVK